MDAQVLAVSTDFIATLAHWAKELDAQFPLLSDHDRKVSQLYGVLLPMGLANRTTFVIDTDGKIADIQEGNAASTPPARKLPAAERRNHPKKPHLPRGASAPLGPLFPPATLP